MKIDELRACIVDMFANTSTILCKTCGHEWQDVTEECNDNLICPWCGGTDIRNLSDNE